jgi:hypothetical protein
MRQPVNDHDPLAPAPDDDNRTWKPEKKAGRPRKRFSSGAMKKFLVSLKGGVTRSMAARWAGMNYGTVRSRYDTDPRFREAVDNAEAFADVQQVLKVTSDSDPKSARWWLGHMPRHRAAWGDNQGGGVNIGIVNGALPPGADLGTMLAHMERRRLAPNAPHDPRPALVAAQQAVDAEVKEKPKRTPVPATKDFIEGREQRRAQGSDHRA